MNDIFSSVDALDVQAVKTYLKDGGNVAATSSKGVALFPYVVMQFLKPDDGDYHTSPFHAPVAEGNEELDLPPHKIKLFEIGTLLMEYGANFDDRLGRTKTSIKISDRLLHTMPLVHREWSSLSVRNKMLKIDNIEKSIESNAPRTPRKI